MKACTRNVIGLCTLVVAASAAVAQPANDDCAGALDFTSRSMPFVTDPVDIAGAAQDPEYPMPCASASGYSVWYKIHPAARLDLTLSTCPEASPANIVSDTVIAVYSSDDGTCANLSLFACNDDFCDTTSTVEVSLAAGTWYYIQVAQWSTSDPGPENVIQMSVQVTPPPPPDLWIENGDAGDLPGRAQQTTGTGTLSRISGNLETGGVDMYAIEICDPAAFSATARGGTGFDSQLWLFSSDGHGVTFNDDSAGTLQSTITGQFVPAPGQYYLAISRYDNDPRDINGNQLWLDDPFDVERAPDDLMGAGSAIDHWDGTTSPSGEYLLSLTGTVYPGQCGSGCPACAADFNQDGGVDGSDIEAFFSGWTEGESCADVNLDGGVDGGDVEYFFVVWESGDPTCGG